MQCDEFDVRLQKVLDHHRAPQHDAQLRRHALLCPQCADTLAAACRLLQGLDLWDVPPLSDDFAERVVQQVAPAPRPHHTLWPALALGVAASLLVCMVPGVAHVLRSGGPRATTAAAPSAGSHDGAWAAAAPAANRAVAVTDSPWTRYGHSLLELYPEETRQRHRQQMSEFAEDLRPIAAPFNTAVTAIRRSIPVRASTERPSPRASLAPRTLSAFNPV
jgi:hypothetical protein